MLQVILDHKDVVLMIVLGIVSEIMAIRQVLKFPDNDGVGGVLAAIMKLVVGLGGKLPPAPPVA